MKDSVGATIGRPQILPKQNLSPQGEKTVIVLSNNPKNYVFRRTSDARPYNLNLKKRFIDSMIYLLSSGLSVRHRR